MRTAEQKRQTRRAWYAANREKRLRYARQWVADHPELSRKYAREYKRRQRAANPAARLSNRLRVRLSKALKGTLKASRAVELVGCSTADLRAHLEAQFEPGMTWGPEVHIDHIRPIASFDLGDPVQQAACFHYTNLQPLWAADNRRKGAAA